MQLTICLTSTPCGIVREALALNQRMQPIVVVSSPTVMASSRGTCAESEDATGCVQCMIPGIMVREALALNQRMQHWNIHASAGLPRVFERHLR